jgi:hypothetical protein
MKNIGILLLVFTLALALTACGGAGVESTDVVLATQPASGSGEVSDIASGATPTPEVAGRPITVEYDSDDLDSGAGSSEKSYITLEGDSIAFEGSGATVDGAAVTITSAGTYSISGILSDGQIIVDTKDEETVVLLLDGADIACSTSAPIYILSAEKTVITLADGTENRVSDGDSYILEDAESDEPSAAIFSRDDLTINGSGSLTVNAN